MSIRQFCTVVDQEEEREVPSSKRPRLDQDCSESDSSTDEPQTSHSCVLASAESSSTDAESSTKAKRKQARKFCNEWCKGREYWLKYLPGQGMFCTLCQKHNKNPFSRGTWNTTPCNRLRLQSTTAHEGCAAHKDACKLEAEKVTTIETVINF